jgi:hypothetical protein
MVRPKRWIQRPINATPPTHAENTAAKLKLVSILLDHQSTLDPKMHCKLLLYHEQVAMDPTAMLVKPNVFGNFQ